MKAKRQNQAEVIAQAIEILAPFNGGRVFEARRLLESIAIAPKVPATVALSKQLIDAGKIDEFGLILDVYRLPAEFGETIDCVKCSKPIRGARASYENTWIPSGKGAKSVRKLAHLACRQSGIRAIVWSDLERIERDRLLGSIGQIPQYLMRQCTGCNHDCDDHKTDSAGNPNMQCDAAEVCACDHFRMDYPVLATKAKAIQSACYAIADWFTVKKPRKPITPQVSNYRETRANA